MGKDTYFQRFGRSLRDVPAYGRKPLSGISGEGRVLIENHIQVLVYQPDEIQIKVSYGRVCIRGSAMFFSQLSSDQLVLCGRIDSVFLCRE